MHETALTTTKQQRAQIEFLPFDPYLFHLPNRIDLPLYDDGYNSSMVTEGMKNLESAYRSALDAGWPPTSLSVQLH